MRVLLVGNGGREHALAWKIAQSDEVQEVICAPGSDGMAAEAKVSCESISADDLDGLVDLAKKTRPDLTVVGPEVPLVMGLVDRLEQLGLTALGPGQAGARLEGSKVFAKELMQRHSIPTADFSVFDDFDQARDFVRANPGGWVVKADGLAAGKGVILCHDVDQAEQALVHIMRDRAFGDAGDRVIIESFLQGEEASCIALSDGKTIRLLASSQDHKRALDGDLGPNTGGMGAYSPAPVLDEALQAEVLAKVLEPLMAGMAAEGTEFKGFIYAGLMITADGPQVLEYNTRLGDPETQPLLVRLKSDLFPVLHAAATGSLAQAELAWDPRPSVCVVLASGGYPGAYQKGKIITGLTEAAGLDDVTVFHAGTRREADQFVTAGGRVLGVCALGSDIRAAVRQAYRAVDTIHFEGMHVRRDIAHRALARL